MIYLLSLTGVTAHDDPWGGMESSNGRKDTDFDPWSTNGTSTYPSLSTQPRKLGVFSDSRGASITSSQRSTPVSSPPPPELLEDADKKSSNAGPIPPIKTVGMSKEDKAAEMARRKEERRQVSKFCFRPYSVCTR